MGNFNDWSTTPASNASVGAMFWAEGQNASTVNNSARQMAADLRYELGANSTAFSAGATTDLGSFPEGLVVLSGNTTISSFGTTASTGLRKKVRVTGTPTLAHSVGAITVQGGANLTLAAGDMFEVVCEGSGQYRVYNVSKANGQAVSGFSISGLSAETSVRSADFIPIYSGSAAANRKVSATNFFSAVNDLTENTTPSQTLDFILTYSGSAGAARKVTAANIGRLVQVVSTQTGAVATGTTVIPGDDTIPQNTEGTEFMTLSITPKSSTNKLRIDVTALLSHSTATGFLAAAIFQDSTANALAAMAQTQTSAASATMFTFSHVMDAGTTSATTFKVRGGCAAVGTTTFNGQSSGRLFGGVFASSIRITEYVP
jgi:hypothetical protein